MNCLIDVAWVLECNCEPMIEHCAQCDARRDVREYAAQRQRIYDTEQEAKRLREKLGMPRASLEKSEVSK